MTTKKDVLGLVDTSREVGAPALVGVEPLHQGAVSPADLGGARAGLKAKDLIGFLFGHWAARRRATLPRCRITLRVFTPAGIPAVKIRCK